MKEAYENKQLFRCIHCDQHQGSLCGDCLRVVAILLGIQCGNTTHGCFLCELESHARNDDYINKDWTVRQLLQSGSKNDEPPALVDTSKIFHQIMKQ